MPNFEGVTKLEHTEACWAMPECIVCGLRKKPHGRDAGVAAANGFCGSDCEGYDLEPRPGHFWPDEEPELLAAIRGVKTNAD